MILISHRGNINGINKGLENQMVNRNIHCFYHQTDDVTLTSKGYLWTSPNKTLTKKSVMVLPEIQNLEIPTKIHGLCSDVIENYEEYR